MKIGVVTFPGSNCDYDCYKAVQEALDAEAVYLWHKEHDLQGVDAVFLPGGFSYGDYLRAGAIAAHSPIMREVIAFANAGGPVAGVCNGFQILCEAGLLPGALMRNRSLKFRSRDVYLRVEQSQPPFTSGYEVGEVHVGRLIVFTLEAQSEAEARERVDAMCRQLLANPVTEDYQVAVRAPAGSAA